MTRAAARLMLSERGGYLPTLMIVAHGKTYKTYTVLMRSIKIDGARHRATGPLWHLRHQPDVPSSLLTLH
jgi:hypothetical protein